MNQFIAFFKDLALRLQAKSPKFFKVLQWISATLVVFAGMALWLNSTYEFGLEKIHIYGTMMLTDLITDIIKILSGVFITAMLTVSRTSKKVDKLKLPA